MSVVNFGSYNSHKRRLEMEMQDRLTKELQIVELKILEKFNTEEDETSVASQQNLWDTQKMKVKMQGYTREVKALNPTQLNPSPVSHPPNLTPNSLNLNKLIQSDSDSSATVMQSNAPTHSDNSIGNVMNHRSPELSSIESSKGDNTVKASVTVYTRSTHQSLKKAAAAIKLDDNNLHSPSHNFQELDDRIQKYIQIIKNDYNIAMNQLQSDNPNIPNHHAKEKENACKKLREFLKDIVSQLEKSLELEFTTREANWKRGGNKQNDSEVQFRSAEVGNNFGNVKEQATKLALTSCKFTLANEMSPKNTNQQCLQIYSSNNYAQEEEMETDTECSIVLDPIIKKYDNWMKEKLKWDRNFELSEQNIQQAHKECVLKSLKELPELLKMPNIQILETIVEEVTKTLQKTLNLCRNDIAFKIQFAQQNKIIHAATLLIAPTKVFYNDLMKKLLSSERILGIKDLEKLHIEIVEECVEAFNKACNFKKISEVPSMGTDLKVELDKQFQSHSTSNDMKLRKISGIVTKAINDQHTKYNATMDELLPRHNPSVSQPVLLKLHESTLAEVNKLLEMEIRNLKLNIPLADHIQVLKDKIMRDLPEIQKSNERKIEKEEQQKLESLRDKKSQEVEAELQQQVEKENSRKRTSLINSNKQSTKSSNSTSRSSSQIASTHISCITNTITENYEELPPIAIEFGLNMTRLGWFKDDRFQFIPNRWGDEETPSKLAWTGNRVVLIGEEVENAPKEEVVCSFILANILNKENYLRYPISSININEDVPVEFLCGLFLSRIKMDTEKQLGGRWVTAIITVPLWYNSVQRQGTKDAAFIAGFSNVHLIKDTSAAALYLANEPRRKDNSEKNCIMVGVQSDLHFDAAIYEYNKGKILMKNSCGDLHCSQKLQGGMCETINGVATAFFDYSVGVDQKYIHEMLKSCAGPDSERIQENLYVDERSSSNRSQSNTIQKAIEKFGKSCEGLKTKMPILSGAAYFAYLIRYQHNAKEFVKDNTTYSFQRSGVGNKLITLLEVNQALNHNTVFSTSTIKTFELTGTSINVREISGDNNKTFDVGTLVVAPKAGVKEIHMKISINNEGIFQMEQVFFSAPKTGQTHPIEFKWNSPNLKESDMKKYIELVKSLRKDEKKEAFKNPKAELNTLINEIESQIEFIQKPFVKVLLRQKVDEALAVVNHSNSTQEMLDDKKIILTALKSKYCY